MSLVVPNTYKAINLAAIVGQTLRLKLYSNNLTPAASSVFANFTEVAGGGYAENSLLSGSWTIVLGLATYIAQNFHFSGATNAPSTVYGYYVVDGSDNLLFAERFPDDVLPFTPTGGSLIRITPELQVS